MAEPLDLWQTRMPAKYRERAFHWPGQRYGKGQYRREGGWDPVARLKDMAADGVVADVLYPTRAKSVFRVDYEPEISEAAARVYAEVPPGEDTNLGIELVFEEPGVYRLYDSSDPEHTKGNFFIIVQ